VNEETIRAIILVIGSGGLILAVVAWRKVGPERQSIIVDAAQGAVVVQQGVIEALEDQLERQRQETDSLRAAYADLDERLKACEEVRLKVERELRVIEQKTELDALGREGKIDRRESSS
jgi:DNA repair exonuclease SbcCD ATPase subunit